MFVLSEGPTLPIANVSLFETACPSQLWFVFESHERKLSVANGRLLVQSQEHSVPPAVETNRHT